MRVFDVQVRNEEAVKHPHPVAKNATRVGHPRSLFLVLLMADG
jgi:hypothetical protein